MIWHQVHANTARHLQIKSTKPQRRFNNIQNNSFSLNYFDFSWGKVAFFFKCDSPGLHLSNHFDLNTQTDKKQEEKSCHFDGISVEKPVLNNVRGDGVPSGRALLWRTLVKHGSRSLSSDPPRLLPRRHVNCQTHQRSQSSTVNTKQAYRPLSPPRGTHAHVPSSHMDEADNKCKRLNLKETVASDETASRCDLKIKSITAGESVECTSFYKWQHRIAKRTISLHLFSVKGVRTSYRYR